MEYVEIFVEQSEMKLHFNLRAWAKCRWRKWMFKIGKIRFESRPRKDSIYINTIHIYF